MTDPTTTAPDSLAPLEADLAAEFRMAPLPPPPPSSPMSPPMANAAAPDTSNVSLTDLALAAAAADLAMRSPVAPLPGTAPTPTVVEMPPTPTATPTPVPPPTPVPAPSAVATTAPAPAATAAPLPTAATPAPAAVAAAAPAAVAVAAPAAMAAAAPAPAPAGPVPPTVIESDAAASSTGRSRRPLLLVLAAVVALAGIVGVLTFVMGGSDDGGSVAFVPEATLSPVATAAPTTAPVTIAPATTVAPTTTAAPTTTVAAVAVPSYPKLPDGSPEPIVAVYDGPTINVVGWVSSQEKLDLLTTLALANSTDPTATVNASVQIDPAVPSSIGIRVIEMNSPRFNAGSSDVTPEHAAQLDRVANVMTALPNVTSTVVGHADQVGDEAANYALSEARAVSVVRYLVSKGIDPSRLSARAVGEQDLLAVDASDASLALNRRTEFIFYGLLAD